MHRQAPRVDAVAADLVGERPGDVVGLAGGHGVGQLETQGARGGVDGVELGIDLEVLVELVVAVVEHRHQDPVGGDVAGDRHAAPRLLQTLVPRPDHQVPPGGRVTQGPGQRAGVGGGRVEALQHGAGHRAQHVAAVGLALGVVADPRVLVVQQEAADVGVVDDLSAHRHGPHCLQQAFQGEHIDGDHAIDLRSAEFGPHPGGHLGVGPEAGREQQVAEVLVGAAEAPLLFDVGVGDAHGLGQHHLGGGFEIGHVQLAVGRRQQAGGEQHPRAGAHLPVVGGQQEVGGRTLQDRGQRGRGVPGAQQ